MTANPDGVDLTLASVPAAGSKSECQIYPSTNLFAVDQARREGAQISHELVTAGCDAPVLPDFVEDQIARAVEVWAKADWACYRGARANGPFYSRS
jgi:hypothetical protein